MKTLAALLVMLLLSPFIALAELPAESFDEVYARADQLAATDEGKAYEKMFSETFAKPMQDALRGCVESVKPPFTVGLVFIVGADGVTQRIIAAPGQTVSACAAKKLNGLKLPAPPKADWPVAVKISIEP